MKIQRLSISNHPALGTVALDFTDGAGGTFSTVVIAGGNGTGKTAILETIFQTFQPGLGPPTYGVVGMDLEFSEEDVANLRDAVLEQNNATLPEEIGEFRLVWDSAVTNDWAAYNFSWIDGSGQRNSIVPVMGRPEWRPLFRTFFSEAAVDFNSNAIGSVTALSVDDPSQAVVKSGPSLGTQIAQLLVDIRAADAEDLHSWVDAHPDEIPPESVKELRFRRFRAAFEYMFPAKRFARINRQSGSIQIEFEEFGKTSTLEQLSTGEKQIVFRAGFFLQRLATVRTGIILVDEPELSLHPEWQARITGFYTHLLSDASARHPQLIFSTHSPFIVHGAANARVVVLQKDPATGIISQMPEPRYPGVSGAEAVRAFNIDGFLRTAQKPLLILTEGESDKTILETAWDKLYPDRAREFELRAALGEKNVGITLRDDDLFTKLGPDRLIVGLFDFDAAYNQWKGVWKGSELVSAEETAGLVKRHRSEKGWAMLLPVPAHRQNWASQELGGDSILSIEFLFENSDIPDAMVAQRTIAQGQTLSYFKKDKKTDFANLVRELPAASFAAFKPLFERWEEILDGRL